jgi:hypothetical protein
MDFYEWGKRVGCYYPKTKTYLRYGSHRYNEDGSYGVSARICKELETLGCIWVVIRNVGQVKLAQFLAGQPKERGMEPQLFVKEEHFETRS